MFNREDITEALLEFTRDSRVTFEDGDRWFDDQGISTHDLTMLYHELMTRGTEVMKGILDEATELDEEQQARADALIEVFSRCEDDKIYEAILVTLMMMATGIGIKVQQKKHENEIEWDF